MGVGELLKTEREKRQISIEQIASHTKISLKILNALENEKFNELPAKPFIKGFIKSYCSAMNISPDEFLHSFEEQNKKSDFNTKKTKLGNFELARESNWQQHKFFAVAVIGILMVISIVLVAVMQPRHHKKRMQKEMAKVEAVGPVKTEQVATQDKLAASVLNVAEAEESEDEIDEDAPPSKLLKTSDETLTNESDVNKKFKYKLIVKAKEDSWIKAQADDGEVRSLILKQGKSIVVKGDKVIKFLTGNVGDLEFFFNGKTLSPQGRKGEVKTIIFPVEMTEKYEKVFKVNKKEDKKDVKEVKEIKESFDAERTKDKDLEDLKKNILKTH